MTARHVTITPIDGRIPFNNPETPPPSSKPKWGGLRTALRPLLFVSKMWGLAPLTLGPSNPPKHSALIFSVFFVLILAVIHAAAVIYSFLNSPAERHITYVTGFGVQLFNRVCALLNHVFLLSYRSTMVSAIASIVALDDEWKPAGSKWLATLVNIELVGVLACIVTESSLACYRYYWQFSPTEVVDTLVEVAVIASLSLLVLQWTNLVLSLAHHMDALIVQLVKLYPPSNDSFSMIRRPPSKNNWRFLLIENDLYQGVRRINAYPNKVQSPTMNIPSLRRLHRDIHSALQKLQTTYGGPLTIGFSVAIINTVMAVFDLRYTFEVKSVMWVTWCAVSTWLMVMPCQLLLDKTQKCADVLHGAMQNDIRAEDRKQLLDFSVQLLDLPLSCSSCNFFLLDNRKLISVLGTIVTYVIILSQFEPKGNDSSATNSTNCSIEESS